LAAAALLWMAGHRLPSLIIATCLVVSVGTWAGPGGVLRFSLAAEIVLVIAGLMLHRALRRVSDASRKAAAEQREALLWQTELDAFHLERQTRLRVAEGSTAPMLRRIVDEHGDLDEASRTECRVLEQTLRDEIRGRRLVNDATRTAVLRQRRRGAFVQVLDDGGLDDIPPRELNILLDEVAQRLAALRSSRIVIRTGQPESDTAITIVASSPDETSAALGLDRDDDDDEVVELWASIPRPTTSAQPM
jgi:hypothetical protein